MKTRDEILWLVGQHALAQLYALEKDSHDPEEIQELQEDSAHLSNLLNDLWVKAKGHVTHA